MPTKSDTLSNDEYTSTRTPLLGNFPQREDEDEPLSRSQCPKLYVLGLVFSIVFAADLGTSISKAPLIRIYESIICSDYYGISGPSLLGSNGFVEERYCKVAPIQEELALLRGWQEFFDHLPGLFLAIPFGMLADTYGRKRLSVVNVTSIWARAVWMLVVCIFPHLLPLRLIWLQSALAVFGGGSIVASALFLVIATDVTPESQRANVFFYAHALLCTTEFLGPPIGSLLMNQSPWAPLVVSIGLFSMTIPLALLLPETLHRPPTDDELSSNPSTSHPQSHTNSIFSKFSNARPQNRSPISLMADHRIPFILLTSISYIFAQACSNIVTQYTSRRYTWTISQSAYLGSIRAIIMILALLVGLPFASTYLLRRRSFTPLRKDVLLLRISFTTVAAGLLFEGSAPSIPLFIVGCCIATTGMGATALIRSFLSSLVRGDEVGILFAVMSLVWTAAMLVASPVVAKLFSEGLKRGGFWVGMPFLFVGGLFVGASVAMWVVNLDGPTVVEKEREEDEKQQEEAGEDDKDEASLRGTTPSVNVDVDRGTTGSKPVMGKHVPAPLVLEGSFLHGLRTPGHLETPLFSPGLQIMESRGGF